MILWYDDIRVPPPLNGIFWARTNDMAYEFIHDNCSNITHSFLDHDMGLHNVHPKEVNRPWELMGMADEDGLDLAKYVTAMGADIGIITIHSWNPHGALAMKKEFVRAGYPDVYIDPFREEWYNADFLLPELRP